MRIALMLRSMQRVASFVGRLARRQHTDDVFNQYREAHCQHNLLRYLHYLIDQDPTLLLIGEAPGYRGCRLTGIPFTSPRIMRESKAEFFLRFRNELVISGETSEASARIVWETIKEAPTLPILWNVFPFHPHRPGEAASNRGLRNTEVGEGSEYVRDLVGLFRPTRLVGVGRWGERALRALFPDTGIAYVRHPSYGGKTDFQKQLRGLLTS